MIGAMGSTNQLSSSKSMSEGTAQSAVLYFTSGSSKASRSSALSTRLSLTRESVASAQRCVPLDPCYVLLPITPQCLHEQRGPRAPGIFSWNEQP